MNRKGSALQQFHLPKLILPPPLPISSAALQAIKIKFYHLVLIVEGILSLRFSEHTSVVQNFSYNL